MRILLAFDKFKGAFSAREACEAAEAGVRRAWVGAGQRGTLEIDRCPVADGGEGTVAAIIGARGGRIESAWVRDALGQPVEARFGVVAAGGPGAGERVGILEMSAASGLGPLAGRRLDPWRASTFGTGELLLAAAGQGVSRLVVGLGGSATNDGGSGLASALGARFLDGTGRLIVKIPENLADVKEVDLSGLAALPPVLVASDVRNRLLGERGATRVFGSQKGVVAEDLGRHEARLAHWADLVESAVGRSVRDQPGSGAAGALGFGLVALLGAELRSGFEVVAEQVGLERRVRAADLVLTGEGRIDSQSLDGKAPIGVAALARQWGKPVVAVVGQSDLDPALASRFDLVLALARPGEDPARSINAGTARLADTLAANERLRELLAAA